MMTTLEKPSASGAGQTPDVIDHLAGFAPDSRVGKLRAQRPELTRYAQSSYESLLEPTDPAGVSRAERELIALRVAALTNTSSLAAWHEGRLRDLGASDGMIAMAKRIEDNDALSPREKALLTHVDLVASSPAKATKADLDKLTAVGLSAKDIVTVSQLIAFLSFQVRALAGLRLLAEDV